MTLQDFLTVWIVNFFENLMKVLYFLARKIENTQNVVHNFRGAMDHSVVIHCSSRTLCILVFQIYCSYKCCILQLSRAPGEVQGIGKGTILCRLERKVVWPSQNVIREPCLSKLIEVSIKMQIFKPRTRTTKSESQSGGE